MQQPRAAENTPQSSSSYVPSAASQQREIRQQRERRAAARGVEEDTQAEGLADASGAPIHVNAMLLPHMEVRGWKKCYRADSQRRRRNKANNI